MTEREIANLKLKVNELKKDPHASVTTAEYVNDMARMMRELEQEKQRLQLLAMQCADNANRSRETATAAMEVELRGQKLGRAAALEWVAGQLRSSLGSITRAARSSAPQ